MYFVLKSLNFIYIIPLYMFRTPLCPSSGASRLHMQSLVPCGAWFVVSSSPAMLLLRFYSNCYNDVRNHEPKIINVAQLC